MAGICLRLLSMGYSTGGELIETASLQTVTAEEWRFNSGFTQPEQFLQRML